MQIVLHLKDKFGKALALVVVNALRVRLVQAINELDYIDNDLGFNHWFGVHGNAAHGQFVRP